MKKRESTLAEQIKQARAEVETCTPERRANVRLQGSDPYLDAALHSKHCQCPACNWERTHA